MTVWVAFLRAVNVGNRRMKMADLKVVCEGIGYRNVKTILASGNVRFECDTAPKAALEAAIERHWGWLAEALMRRADELEAMIASDPFADWPEDPSYHRYVLMSEQALPRGANYLGAPGDFEIVRVDRREIYLVGHRQPDGRHGPGLDKFDPQLEKGAVVTMRNWKTIHRVLT